MGYTIHQVDAFSSKPFAGNPAAVCLLPKAMDPQWMQNVAAEMNLSETAFLVRQGDGYELRWFTPAVEVDLCGHATLASAHILWQTGAVALDAVARFHTRSGLLTARRRDEWIELNFPSQPPLPVPAPQGLENALGASPRYVGSNGSDHLVELESEKTVRELRPDFDRLAKLTHRGIIVTSLAAAGEYDFVSRMFAPAAGINEDPVTGSAHCCLGPFWGQRLDKSKMVAYQASRRGGLVRVELQGDRVLLQGQAVTVMRGELLNL
jgi:PhzF family phenazine biosynthesis protein